MVKKTPNAGAGEGTRNLHRGGRLKAATIDPAAPAQLVAALQLSLPNAEPSATLQRKTGTRFTPPPPRWGRARVGVIALIGVGVSDRLAVGVTPRTDPW